METKRCRKCQQELPVTAFNFALGNKDGLQPYCRTCHKAMIQAWREKNTIRNRARFGLDGDGSK